MKQLNLFEQGELSKKSGNPPAPHAVQVHTWQIYIDGASRNNPGQSGAGVIMKKDDEVVTREGFFLGIKTNNQAEYLALLLALFFLKQYAKSDDIVRIASDSELLVKQVRGHYKVRNEELKLLHGLAMTQLKGTQIDVLHVMREDNVLADKLANQGIDKKKPLPQSFIEQLKVHGISL